MPDPNRYSLEEIEPRLAVEDIDVAASFELDLKFTIQVRKKPSTDRDDVFGLWLRWARTQENGGAEQKFSPYRAHFLRFGELLPLLAKVFGIHEDARVWYSASRSEMNYQDAWMHMLEEREDISFRACRPVAVAVHPYLGRHDEVLSELAIELQFGPPRSFWERGTEECAGWGMVDPWFGPARTGVLTFADLTPAFALDPQQRIWRVGAAGDFISPSARDKYLGCNCGDPAGADEWRKAFGAPID